MFQGLLFLCDTPGRRPSCLHEGTLAAVCGAPVHGVLFVKFRQKTETFQKKDSGNLEKFYLLVKNPSRLSGTLKED